MQVLYDEGVANHIGPEPCVGVREHAGEASVGEIVGQVMSRENRLILGADALREAEGNTKGRTIASARSARRGRRPWHAKTLLDRELGDLTADRGRCESIGRGPHREGEELKPMGLLGRLAPFPGREVFSPLRSDPAKQNLADQVDRHTAPFRPPEEMRGKNREEGAAYQARSNAPCADYV